MSPSVELKIYLAKVNSHRLAKSRVVLSTREKAGETRRDVMQARFDKNHIFVQLKNVKDL